MKPWPCLAPALLSLCALLGGAAACAAPPQSLYVVNYGAGGISDFDAAGNGAVFPGSGMSAPVGLAFDPAGDLFVSNISSSTIEKYVYANGSLSTTGAPFAGSAQGLNYPYGMTFDNAGNLYVANNGGSSIEKFDALGNGATFAVGSAQGVSGPDGLAFDGAGDLFVSNEGSNTIVEYVNTAGTLNPIGTPFTSAGLNRPFALAFDSTGNLYVANFYGNDIMKYAVTGGVLSANGSVFADSLHGVSGPVGLTFDGSGDLFIANNSNSSLEEYVSSSGMLSGTGIVFASGGTLSSPDFIAFGPAPTSAPEPSAWAIWSLGAAALLGLGWKARKETQL